MANNPDQIIGMLEETSKFLQKANVNLKKCSKERLTKGYIEARIKSIEEYWTTFKQAHQDLVKCTTREQRGVLPYFVNEEFFIQEDIYLNLQATLKDMLTLKTKCENKDNSENQNSSSSSVNPVNSMAKLPRIQLPTFSGIYEEWPTYQDLFMSLVHQDSSLSSVQKLHYLKTSITGEASALLKHIQITDSNYSLAWDTLRNRFGNRRLIVNSLLKRLFGQRKQNIQSAQNLKLLLDTSTEILRSLENMNISTASWDPVTIFLVVQKLDTETHKQWEEFAYKENTEQLPTWEDLRKFLETKFRTLELITPVSTHTVTTRERTKDKVFHITSNPKQCLKCDGNHTLSHCGDFAKLLPNERSLFVNNNNLCFNCLIPGHAAKMCRAPYTCRICRKRHHSLLHQSSTPSTSGQHEPMQPTVSNQYNEEEVQVHTGIDSQDFSEQRSTALLATALVKIMDDYGNTTTVKALIDNGSQASFLSERAAQILRLKRTQINGTITGVGSIRTTVKHATDVHILSLHDTTFKLKIKTYIMPTRLTSQLPARFISTTTWPHLEGLVLADPNFNQPGRVDMLLGVDVCAQIMKGEIIKGPLGAPSAQNTHLGWILFGTVQEMKSRNEIITMHLNLDLDNMLKQMWEQNVDEKRLPTAEERKCEEIYKTTTSRSEDGRYIVKLPTKTDNLLSKEGNTRDIALKRLYQLEKRFEKDENLKKEYVNVMEEYKEMTHMEEVPPDEINKPAIYLPHHAITREEKETSKVRTVFNASQKGTNGISLNEELLVGPQLQDDMRSLILRWRMKRICFVADIQKMYRQIRVTKEDSDLQRVLWRKSKDEDVKDYRLGRVTFGTASAPFLAVRTLHQLAEDEGYNHPDAAAIIKQDFYMDDLMSGKDTLQEAITTAKDIDFILRKGGFILQKWCSNNAEFLKQFQPSERSSSVKLDITLDGSTRALGLYWNMGTDKFKYSFNLPFELEKITKRTILAEVQRLFDPLGWLAPSILPAKILIQKLWLQGISWDEEIDQTSAEEWLDIRDSFQYLPEIEVDRWLQTTEDLMNNVSVHGFCDASTQAYGAVAYLRVLTTQGKVKTTIIGAKTRVASIKSKSLPRLELCGAVLLAGLLKQIKEALRIPSCQIYAWTDSTIVLSWLLGDPTRWNVYVRNRVVEILEEIGNQNWYHVQSQENPADVASRGIPLQDLKHKEMWWKGPEWLQKEEIKFTRPKNITTNLERKEIIHVNLKIENNTESIVRKFENFNNLKELLNVIIYSKRFLKGNKLKDKEIAITTKELDEALKTCIKLVQKESFDEDIKCLRTNKRVKENSKLKFLNPYLDEDDILRVGGRLRHAEINEESKHPIILDHDTYLTTLIVADAHIKTLHGGPQLMLGYLRSKYWILKGKNLVKLKFRKCLVCAKHNAIVKSQVMGDLPRERVTPHRPFLHSGVDFAGPFQILLAKGRGNKTTKSYIAVFVCMSTKAIHLELVGDMTSESFIAAMRRFVARRGKCAHLWSDQGRNFVGANKELTTAWSEAKLEFQGHIAETLAQDGTQWHFIPAYSPHMGGLWEAGVKSMKYHLKRILTANLTYEEMYTLLCQIEACLNSRPLSPIDDSDTDDITPLTPGHFLVGEAPINIPNPNLQDIPQSHLSRWQHLQRMLGGFWRRWQGEYLSQLQQRRKWHKKSKELEIGQIVHIKNDNLPPGKWMLGRIVSKHPGPDGVTRVYSVKGGDSVVQRSVCKLYPLPIDID